MANRQNFSRDVQREIARRAVNSIGEKRCENCGAVGVPLDLHHLRMDAMQTPEAKRKPLAATDGAMFCLPCHKPESARQQTVLAKVEAVEANHWLPRKRAKVPIRSRGFAEAAEKDRTVTKQVSRRPLFVETN